jgi:hypothetical protein
VPTLRRGRLTTVTQGRAGSTQFDAPVSAHGDGWEIRDGASAMLRADDLDDALAALAIVERHTRQCFIGRGNTRPNRKNYIMMYWE